MSSCTSTKQVTLILDSQSPPPSLPVSTNHAYVMKTAIMNAAAGQSQPTKTASTNRHSGRYIKNYNTSGICEQNFCLCFTHSVDVLTFLLSLVLGRSEHRLVFCVRICVAFLFDLCISLLFLHYFPPIVSPYFICIPTLLSFMVSNLAFISVLYENQTSLTTRISVMLSLPSIELAKAFIRCSNNLFCREDQENLAQYLQHRPLNSLYFAYVAKAGIFTSGVVTYIGILTMTSEHFSAIGQTHGSYLISVGLCTFDLLRNAYQAIVAENNHASRAKRYSDTLVRENGQHINGDEANEEGADEENRNNKEGESQSDEQNNHPISQAYNTTGRRLQRNRTLKAPTESNPTAAAILIDMRRDPSEVTHTIASQPFVLKDSSHKLNEDTKSSSNNINTQHNQV